MVAARVTVVGFDPSPEPLRPGPSLTFFGGSTVALFHDSDDRLPFGVVASAYADASGVATLDVEPGQYQLFVGRGTEVWLHYEDGWRLVHGHWSMNGELAGS